MDKEMQAPGKASGRCCSKLCLLVAAAAVAIVLCIAFSSVAMVMSVLTYRRDAATTDTVVVVGDTSWEERALSELESAFEREHIMSFKHQTHSDDGTETDRVQRASGRSQLNYDEMCNSTARSGNLSNSKPVAHIVSKHFSGNDRQPIHNKIPHNEDYVVITKNWICHRDRPSENSPHQPNNPFGFISGGMVFNRATGFLILPIDGVYYVYSHAQFKLWNSSVTYETSARMVACIPGEDCEMQAVNHYPTLLRSTDTVSQQLSRPSTLPNGENGLYQGGLFHFPAHTQISLLAKDPKWSNYAEWFQENKLFTSKVGEDAYMGAFLVQEMPYHTA